MLFRSGFHSFDLELELQRRDIPFIKRGGFKFIETAHVKDVLAHLRVIVNPADAVSWLRALMLVPGVGHRRAERLIEEIVAAPEPEQALVRAAESMGSATRAGGGPGSSAGATAGPRASCRVCWPSCGATPGRVPPIRSRGRSSTICR